MKKKVITYGTFDSFHIGHKNMINNCIPSINDVYVGVASDSYVKSKGKKSIFSEQERMKRVALIPGVKRVFLEENLDQWESDYKEFNIDRIVMGSDHIGELDYFITEKNMNLSYVGRTKGISTTEIKTEILSNKVGLVYLSDEKRNWTEVVLKAKRENSLVIIGLLDETFEKGELYQKLVDVDELFNPYIIYVVDDIEQKQKDIERFNANKFYF